MQYSITERVRAKQLLKTFLALRGASPIHNMNIDAFFLRPRAPFRAL